MATKYFLKVGDTAYTTGALVEWDGVWWKVVSFEDETYYDGEIVEDIEGKPFTEVKE